MKLDKNTLGIVPFCRVVLRSFLWYLLAVVILFPSAPVRGQEKQELEVLKKQVVTNGKLKFTVDPPIVYIDKNQMQHYVDEWYDEEYSVQMGKKEAVYLRLMGFLDKTINVREIRKRIRKDNITGVYDQKSGKLLMLPQHRDLDYMNSMIMVHELRRALQDNHYNLKQLLASVPYSDFDDRKLALVAALEGDATFMMVQCSQLDPAVLAVSQTADALLSFAPVPKISLMYKEPDVIKRLLVMPYLHGLRFVNALYKKKKWNIVNRVLNHPPLSTEQILHPEKYIYQEHPVEVSITFQPEGYQLYHSGVVGEYFLNVLLKPDGLDVYAEFARGWGGDTFHIYKHPEEKSYFLAWKSVWDKDVYCNDFHAAFKRFIEEHFKITLKKGTHNGINFLAGKNEKEYFFILRHKTKFFYARSNNRKQMNTFIYGGNYD